ncbi:MULTISPECIES: TetR/AcrR family transcriptional regulator [unclassified Empedobacter]|uniref:TetR/AcrR family transcriptional regulator n=1 Tax=unclassified Empedobacter TaxID=2643773 RepID=UPI0025C34349|nr:MULTISPECIES: TetR family transcriptional regulator [unclassified Empedobacter]
MNSKDRILQAAEDMFYQKGYPLTTIRDIAAKAKMNSAVINYHFGSKENLYLTILKKMEKALNSVCIKSDIPENDLFVKNFIKNSFTEVCLQHKVFHLYLKEQSQFSTEASEKLVRKFQDKHLKHFSSLVRLQSHNEIPNKKIELLYHSIFGMVKELFRSHKIKLHKEREDKNAQDIEEVISYIDQNYLTKGFLLFFQLNPN